MRARSLKPGYFKNEILGSADPLYGTLFQGLWCMADREGRLEDRPLRICAEVFPYRRNVTEKKVDKMLDWLHENGFIERYEAQCAETTASDQKRNSTNAEHAPRRYIQVIEFACHQNPHKNEAPSKIPALSSISHRACTVQSTVRAPCDDGPKTEVAPSQDGTTRADSGLLTPDSGLLTPDSSLRENAREQVPRGTAVYGEITAETTGSAKAIYPAGIYRQADWILAEREIRLRLEEGYAPAVMLGGCERYGAQVRAKGGEGGQYVFAPSRFFRERMFLEPFPLPAKAPTATEQLLRNLERGNDSGRVIDHEPDARTATAR